MNENNVTCALLAETAQHPLVLPLNILNALMLTIAFIGGIDLLGALHSAVTVPINVRIVLQLHTGACIWWEGAWMFRTLLDIARYVSLDVSDECLKSAWYCAILTALVFTPATLVAIAPLIISIERAIATRRLAHGKMIINNARQAPIVILSLLLPCGIVCATTLFPYFHAATSGATGSVFCTMLDGTFISILRSIAPLALMELTSFGLILYVYFINRRVHRHWSHLVNADQMLPIRVALRRNMDITGALIVSGLLHAASFACAHGGSVIVYLLHAPRIPPVVLAIYSDLVLRMFIGFHMLCHPWILIGMMPALHDSFFIRPTLGFVQCMVKKTNKSAPANNDVGSFYFNELQRQWHQSTGAPATTASDRNKRPKKSIQPLNG